MSHFVTLVLVRNPGWGDTLPSRDVVESAVQPLMEPYNEQNDVAPYEEKCDCVHWAASGQARRDADEKFAETGGQMRERVFAEIVSEIGPRPRHPRDEADEAAVAACNEYEEQHQTLWRAKTHERFEWEEARTAELEAILKPSDDCEECAGSGTRTSTYNPKSKWDWWQIGGRWTGMYAPDYDPEKDPRNIETCFLCNGTGQRGDSTSIRRKTNEWPELLPIPRAQFDDMLADMRSGSPDRQVLVEAAIATLPEAHEPLPGLPSDPVRARVTEAICQIMAGDAEIITWCNGCDGKGRKAKWPTDWRQFDGDILPVSALLEQIARADADGKPWKGYPYALVTPDGEWVGKGRMGWFGVSHDEDAQVEWHKTVRAALADNADAIGVVVDCHI